MSKSCRVRLVKELTPELPLGTEGVVDRPNITDSGMYMVRWDNGLELPMYRNEIEPVANVEGCLCAKLAN